MVDHVLETMPTADSASELHSEYGGAAAEFSAQPAAEPAAVFGAVTASPAADPMVNPIGLSRAEENAMRSDSAAVGGGRLAGRAVAGRRAVIGGLTRHSKQAPPGWKPSPALGEDAATAPGVLPSAAEPAQRRSRFSATTIAPSSAGAKLGERLFQRFCDPALERQFCLSQAALLRPVRPWLGPTHCCFGRIPFVHVGVLCATSSGQSQLCRRQWSSAS